MTIKTLIEALYRAQYADRDTQTVTQLQAIIDVLNAGEALVKLFPEEQL